MEDQIYIIIAKALQGEASKAELAALDAWLQEMPEHRDEYDQMVALWQEADNFIDAPHFDAAPAWDRVSRHIGIAADIANVDSQKSRVIAFPSWVKFAASIAAVLIITFLLWNPFTNNTVTIAAIQGNMTIELPDKSVITLHKGSSLSYPKAFAANERKVKLEGEAFFEVMHNEQKPFVIDAQSVEVKVLGTTFNVKCDEASADVAVSTGRVQVTAGSGNDKQTAVLPAGVAAHYQNGKISEAEANGDEADWKDDLLKFNGERLSAVVETIASKKNAVVKLDAGMNAAQREQAITATFRNQPLEDMLTELCLIAGCRWEKNGNSYLILAK